MNLRWSLALLVILGFSCGRLFSDERVDLENSLREITQQLLISSRDAKGDFSNLKYFEHLDKGVREKIETLEEFNLQALNIDKEAKKNGVELIGLGVWKFFEVDYIFRFPKRNNMKWELENLVVSDAKNVGLVDVEIFYAGDEEQKVWVDRNVEARMYFRRDTKKLRWVLSEIYFEDAENPKSFWTLSSNLGAFYNQGYDSVIADWRRKIRGKAEASPGKAEGVSNCLSEKRSGE